MQRRLSLFDNVYFYPPKINPVSTRFTTPHLLTNLTDRYYCHGHKTDNAAHKQTENKFSH
jgi:hypothetical protein